MKHIQILALTTKYKHENLKSNFNYLNSLDESQKAVAIEIVNSF